MPNSVLYLLHNKLKSSHLQTKKIFIAQLRHQKWHTGCKHAIEKLKLRNFTAYYSFACAGLHLFWHDHIQSSIERSARAKESLKSKTFSIKQEFYSLLV
jgi:hypothetical protein